MRRAPLSRLPGFRGLSPTLAHLAAVLMLVGFGCRNREDPTSVAAYTMAGGQGLDAWMAQERVSAAVLVDPTICLSCDNRIHSLQSAILRSMTGGRAPVRVLLTSAPSDFQRRQLVLQGFPALPVMRTFGHFTDTAAVHVLTVIDTKRVMIRSLSDTATRTFLRSLLAAPKIPSESVVTPGQGK